MSQPGWKHVYAARQLICLFSSIVGPEVGAEHGNQVGLLLRVGSAEEAGLCPVAHYCPVGSAIPTPCPAGTYTNLSGQAECFRCPAGYYCPEKTSNYTRFPCLPGFYCPDGAECPPPLFDMTILKYIFMVLTSLGQNVSEVLTFMWWFDILQP